jgi:hypothetical protein
MPGDDSSPSGNLNMGYLKGFGGMQKKITRGVHFLSLTKGLGNNHSQMVNLPRGEAPNQTASQHRPGGKSLTDKLKGTCSSSQLAWG